jgi:hypothetical protein
MLLGGNPKMSITPITEFSELLDFGMVMIPVILDWKTFRIEDAHVTAETEKNS